MSTSTSATTANCFVCGQETKDVHSQFQSKRTREILEQWKKKWGLSLCHILQLNGNLESIFAKASLCFRCQEAACHAEFTLNAISRLQSELGIIRDEVKGLFLKHYETIIQGGGILRTQDPENKWSDKIIEVIAFKVDSDSQTGDDNSCSLPDLSSRSETRLQKLKSRFQDLQKVESTDGIVKQFNENSSRTNLLPRKKSSKGTINNSKRKRPPPILKSPLKVLPKRESDIIGGGIKISSVVSLQVQTIPVSPSPNNEATRTKNDYDTELVTVAGIHDEEFEGIPRLELVDPVGINSTEIETHTQLPGADNSNVSSGVVIRNKLSDVANPPKRKRSRKSSSSGKVTPKRRHKTVGSESGTKLKKTGESHLTCNHEPCRGLNLEFKIRGEVREHILNCHGGMGLNKLHHCAQCPYQTSRSGRLRSHIESVHIKGRSYQHLAPLFGSPLNCPICFKTFQLEDALKEHELLHSLDAPYACVICSETNLNSAASLRRHVQFVHDGMGYWCNDESCLGSFVVFGRLRELKAHMANEHPLDKNQRLHHCTECPSRFSESDRLRLHLMRHSADRSFICEVCGKSFKTKPGLRVHMGSAHTQFQMKLKCSFCTKTLESGAEAEQHESLHLPEIPLKCVICDKMLRSTLDLQRHVSGTHERRTPS